MCFVWGDDDRQHRDKDGVKGGVVMKQMIGKKRGFGCMEWLMLEERGIQNT